MSWARFDDLYDDNRKVKRAWRECRAAVGLHSMAITYCARHETDGTVDLDWLEEKLPRPTERTRALETLTRHGLFERVDDDHYVVHDYLEYNESRSKLAERRARDAERKAAGRRNGGHRPRGVRPDSDETDDGFREESNGPDPSHPDPSPNAGEVRFNGKPVPQPTLVVAEHILSTFNRRAGTHYRPLTSDGHPSENLKRILGAIVADDRITAELGARMVETALADPEPYWGQTKPHPGNVFGPKVVDRYREQAEGGGTANQMSTAEYLERFNELNSQ